MGIPQDIAGGLDLFKSLVFDPLVEGLVVSYEGGLMAVPIVGKVAEEIQLDFANRLYDAMGKEVVLSSVLFVTLAHRQAFMVASTNLQQVAVQYGINSPQFITAHAKEKDALKKFGQFSIAQPGLAGK